MQNVEKTGRAIILINNKLVSMKRTKIIDNEEYIYYTIPGGHVEQGETFEDATVREIEEELGIKIKIKKEALSMYNEDLNRYEKFFICDYVSGEIGSGIGEEWSWDTNLYGKCEIYYIDLCDLDNYNLLPLEIKEIIAKIKKTT